MKPLSSRHCEIAALGISAVVLLGVVLLHLVSALLAGVATFLIIHAIAKLTTGRIPHHWGKMVAVALIATLVVVALVVGVLGSIALFKSEAGFLGLMHKVVEIIASVSQTLPPWLGSNLPTNPEELQRLVIAWFHSHSPEVQLAGKSIGLAFAHTLIGMIIGAMLAFHQVDQSVDRAPLAAALYERVRCFVESFRKVVFAQIRISAINTALTSIYLLLVLPAMGMSLPFTDVIIVATFLLGLLPVIGNLLSNIIIVTVSLSKSAEVALGSLAFLVIIHKLEYFLNARIVGGQIKAKSWELLLAMLVMEAMFGLPGLAIAPIYYAYLKAELSTRGLI